MKYIKVLGLAAVAAMAMMAIMGAGTASATTVLCSTVSGTQGGCNSGKFEYKGEIKAELTPEKTATLTSEIVTVHCKKSTTTINALSSTPTEGTTVTGEVTGLTFTECKTGGGTNCTVTVEGLPYPGHIEGTVGGATTSKLVATAGKAKVVCGFVINCTFSTNKAELTGHNLTTPTTTEFTAKDVPLDREGGICPAEAFWDAEYIVTSPAGFTVN